MENKNKYAGFSGKLLLSLVLGALVLGIFMECASADTKNERFFYIRAPAVNNSEVYLQSYISPDYNNLINGEIVWFRFRTSNTYNSYPVLKGTKVLFRLYDSYGKVLRSKTASISGLKSSKTVRMLLPYRFKYAGEYTLVVEIYNKNYVYGHQKFDFTVHRIPCLTC